MRDGFAWVLGSTGDTEGLRAVEGDRCACLALRSGVGARKSSLFGGLGLGILATCRKFSTNEQFSETILNEPLGAAALDFVDFALAILSEKKTKLVSTLRTARVE